MLIKPIKNVNNSLPLSLDFSSSPLRTPPPDSNGEDADKNNTGVYIGVAAGAAAGAVLVGAAYYGWRRRQNAKLSTSPDNVLQGATNNSVNPLYLSNAKSASNPLFETISSGEV
jgi:hypothetical protein